MDSSPNENWEIYQDITTPFSTFPRSTSTSQTSPSFTPTIEIPKKEEAMPPTTFSTLPPPSVPVRLEPHSQILDKLTEEFESKGPHPILRDPSHNRIEQNDALAVLEKHMKDRMPFVQLTSRRLQAVIGLKNDLPFDLGPQGNMGEDNEMMGSFSAATSHGHRIPICETPSTSPTTSEFTPPSSATSTSQDYTSSSPSVGLGISMPPSMHNTVDPNTGKGLREYLLLRGAMTGMRKRECRSISLHDFTPDMREGAFRNELLAHFGVEGTMGNAGRERIECSQVELPDHNGILQPWLSILIQRPLINYQSQNFPTHPCPPNFPHPTPTSWVMFAAPLSHITSYPIQQDTALPSSLLESTVTSRGLPTRKVALRQDFDFSFQGVPIFEFSNKPSACNHLSGADENEIVHNNNFLSLSMPIFSPDSLVDMGYETLNEDSIQEDSLAWHYFAEAGGSEEEFIALVKKGLENCPYEGAWWHEYYVQAARDRIRWERVREAMTRGKCRVVVRWQEVPRLSGDFSSWKAKRKIAAHGKEMLLRNGYGGSVPAPLNLNLKNGGVAQTLSWINGRRCWDKENKHRGCGAVDEDMIEGVGLGNMEEHIAGMARIARRGI